MILEGSHVLTVTRYLKAWASFSSSGVIMPLLPGWEEKMSTCMKIAQHSVWDAVSSASMSWYLFSLQRVLAVFPQCPGQFPMVPVLLILWYPWTCSTTSGREGLGQLQLKWKSPCPADLTFYQRPWLFHSHHFHVHIKQLMRLRWNCRVRIIHGQYLSSQTIFQAPGQAAAFVPACDFRESAASGFAALLPRFLGKQLKSSKTLWVYRYKGKTMATLTKPFQDTVSLSVMWEGRRVIIPLHISV